jgi:acyl-CoA-binding protein
MLEQYFSSCFANWKIYKGERTPHQVLKLLAIYRQATQGDNKEMPPDKLDSASGLKWLAWRKLRGMPTTMAKRRFITYLSEINPTLIDVMPDEKPPVGFPLDRKGTPICAKCNTKVGCMRPLLDQVRIYAICYMLYYMLYAILYVICYTICICYMYMLYVCGHTTPSTDPPTHTQPTHTHTEQDESQAAAVRKRGVA